MAIAHQRVIHLPAGTHRVPIKQIKALLWGALEASLSGAPEDAAEEAGFNFGCRIDDEYITRLVLSWRDSGKLQVLGPDGFGSLANGLVLHGELRCDELRSFLMSEFDTEVIVDGIDGTKDRDDRGAEPRFADPGHADDKARRPQQTQPAQEAEIIRVLIQLGHDPMRLPPRSPGRPWVKSAVWADIGRSPLFTTEGVFKKAWERLRAGGLIAERLGL